jgi:hypothetical protein
MSKHVAQVMFTLNKYKYTNICYLRWRYPHFVSCVDSYNIIKYYIHNRMQSLKFTILFFIWSKRLSGGCSERDRQQIADVHGVRATVAHPSLTELHIQNSINPLFSFTHHNTETKRKTKVSSLSELPLGENCKVFT